VSPRAGLEGWGKIEPIPFSKPQTVQKAARRSPGPHAVRLTEVIEETLSASKIRINSHAPGDTRFSILNSGTYLFPWYLKCSP